MSESLQIPNEEKRQVPITAKGRIKELMKLSLVEKVNFLPHSGFQFNMGPYVYEVAVVHAGKLRFTAKLVDVIVKGVNDGQSDIINPATGQPFENNESIKRNVSR